MNKFTLTCLTFLSVLLLSCSNELPNNHEIPSMEAIHFNSNDTIQYAVESAGSPQELITKTIYINQLDERMLDTLLIGKDVRLFGKFSSENGLSGIEVSIFGDTLLISQTDTCFNKIKVPTLADFYGLENATVDSLKVFDVISAYEVSLSGDRKVIRTGDEYKYSVKCGDRVGNLNTQTYSNKPIVILTREQVLEARGL